MNLNLTLGSLLPLAGFATAAHAQAQKIREQGRAALAEAIRTGDMVAAGEAGMKLNEQFPQRYAKSGGYRPGDAGRRCIERVRALTQSWEPRS